MIKIYKKLSFKKAKNALIKHKSNRYAHIYSCTDSTNNQAKIEATNSKNGKIFLAFNQTSGRGRMGRKFFSSDGVYLSILLKPKKKPDNIAFITLVCGLAVFNVINKYCENTKIKWPNDILINNKKVCGILSEAFVDKKNRTNIVVGIGINTNTKSFPDEISMLATSLYKETNIYIDNTQIAINVLNEFEKYYNIFLNGDFSSIIKEYKVHCLNIGQDISIISNNEPIRGKIININDMGEIVVKTNSDQIFNLNSGEVTFHPGKA